MAEAVQRFLDSGGDRSAIGDREGLSAALERVEAHRALRPDRLDRRAINRRLHQYARGERAEAALGEERGTFIEGCPREWAALPPPGPPLTVGIDGGYVRQWDDKKTHFEVIVGKSMSEAGPSRCFGFVQTPMFDPLWRIDVEDGYRGAGDRRRGKQRGTIPVEVLRPYVRSRIKKRCQFTGHRIVACNV